MDNFSSPFCVLRSSTSRRDVLVDVGMHRKSDRKLYGDVDATFETGVAGKASALTPVPGGVGPMTIAMLLVNTAAAAWSKSNV